MYFRIIPFETFIDEQNEIEDADREIIYELNPSKMSFSNQMLIL